MAEKKQTRRGLGRGLSALMADVQPVSVAQGSDTYPRADRVIPIEALRANPDQPRRSFGEDDLEDLTRSIRAKGILQPLIVRPDPESTDRFEIVAGERRWRAAQRAQLHEIPVLVRDFDDTEVLEVAIIENIQRADLNAMEEAAAYRQLMFKFGHTQEKLADALGKSRSHIANLMRLLNLPDSVQSYVSEGKLSAGHARTLITAPDAEKLAQTIIAKGLSVREAEKLAKTSTPSGNPKPKRKGAFEVDKDADTKALEADLGAALNMRISIDHKPGEEKGRLTISYETLEQLDSLCALLTTVQR